MHIGLLLLLITFNPSKMYNDAFYKNTASALSVSATHANNYTDPKRWNPDINVIHLSDGPTVSSNDLLCDRLQLILLFVFKFH